MLIPNAYQSLFRIKRLAIRPTFLCILLFLTSSFIHPINASVNLDSLWSVWQDNTQEDTSRLKAIYDISWDGYIFNKPDSSIIVALQMLEFAQATNQTKWQAKAYNALAAASWMLGNYKEAISYYQKKLELDKQLADKREMATSHNNMGLVFQDLGDFDKALQEHYKSLAFKTEIRDTNGIANSYNNISIIFEKQGNYVKALDYQHKSLALRGNAPKDKETANSYNNIGNIYKQQKEYDKALKFYSQSLEIFKGLDHKKGLAEANANIGAILLEKRDIQEATDYFNSSLKLYEEIGYKVGLAMCYYNLGRIELEENQYDVSELLFNKALKVNQDLDNKKGLAEVFQALGTLKMTTEDYRKAINYCKQGFDIALKINAPMEARNCAKCLYVSLKEQKKYQQALLYHEEYLVWQDSLFNEERTKAIVQLEANFENQQEKNALKIQKKEALLQAQLQQEKMKRRKNLQITSVIIISILIIFFLSFMSNRKLKVKNLALSRAQQLSIEKNKELQLYIESNTQLENFAHTASHDLKAPIRSILNFSQLLEREVLDLPNPKIREYLQIIISSSKNMKQLIDDLLTYSKINSTGINIVEINPKSLLQVLLYDIQTVVEERRALIELNNLPDRIHGDKTKLKQLLQNLILNAIKFVDPTVQPQVTIDCSEQEKDWLFTIQDNGIGIEPKHYQEIFHSFRRLHAQHQYEGSGLGLAVCKTVVEQHKGKIWLQSQPGMGTSFYFTLQKFLN